VVASFFYHCKDQTLSVLKKGSAFLKQHYTANAKEKQVDFPKVTVIMKDKWMYC